MDRTRRDYRACVHELKSAGLERLSRDARMALVLDVLWKHTKDADVAWLGLYTLAEGGDEMVLAVCRPAPACSPIGLHGVCGRAWRERRVQIVPDVHALGEAHIVCDPSNLSEIVVPVLNEDGTCDAVLDLDSKELDAFGESDAEGLKAVLSAAGLTV